jgi:uncharacterized protein YciI
MDVESLLSNIPTPTLEYMGSRRSFAHQHTVVFLRHCSRDDEAYDQDLQLQHLRHLTNLQLLGMLVLNGPILTDHEISGISIYSTDLEEARLLAEADPKVKAGVLTLEAIPWMSVPSEKS